MFRHESLSRNRDRLSGSVSIAVPVGWQAIGFLLAVTVAIAILFMVLGSYDRVETVTGRIVPDSGVSEIVATRGGTVTDLDVVEGQEVKEGQQLATIRVDEDGAAARSPGEEVQAAIARQDASLAAQAGAARQAAQDQAAQLAVQNAGIAAEIAQLSGQIAEQERLIASAETDLDRAREVSTRGFISRRDLQAREDVVTSRRQALAQIRQLLVAKQSAILANQRAASLVSSQAGAQASSIEATRAQVAQQAAATRGSMSYVLRAPRTGRVTALLARVGQRAPEQQQLMSIVPKGSRLTAELAVPSSAMGFVRSGQPVRLAVDAFPYQRFGTVAGTIGAVPASAISVRDRDGNVQSVYPVVVALERDTVDAYGRKARLVPGMTLTARIVTERQTLFEWLFEPFFAVGRR